MHAGGCPDLAEPRTPVHGARPSCPTQDLELWHENYAVLRCRWPTGLETRLISADRLEDLAGLSGGVAARCSLCACRSRACGQRWVPDHVPNRVSKIKEALHIVITIGRPRARH